LAFVIQIGLASTACQFFTDNTLYNARCFVGYVSHEDDWVDLSGQHEDGKRHTDVNRLVIHNSTMEAIPTIVFYAFRNLEFFEAENLNILRLNVGTLQNCDKLRTLNLNDNFIMRLETGVFENCQNLRYIRMMNNRIRSVGEHVFDLPFLQILDLDNNLIVELPERIFEKTRRLVSLSLNSNRLLHLPKVSLLFNPILNYFYASNNLISHIPERAFAGLSLAQLHLNFNIISSIGVGALAINIRSGAYLGLNENRITRLSSNAFEGQTSIGFTMLLIGNNDIVAIERNFFDFMQLEYVWAHGNLCVNRDFMATSREEINEGMQTCFANF
jgi:Leucine-rich repeat (LRR) protein